MPDFQLGELFSNDHTYGPQGVDPRDWHLECLKEYIGSRSLWGRERWAAGPHVYTIYAGTGAGKTFVAGLIASYHLNGKHSQQVVMVCPTRNIRRRTQKVLKETFGVHLPTFHKKRHENGVPRNQQGYILTYGALLSEPELHEKLCRAETLVIFDEIHHLGDKGGWGDAAVKAFGGVSSVVALTGTPYRSDNTRIPFVRYEQCESSELLRFCASGPHGFTYPLGRAVADGVCRKPLFIFHAGRVRIRTDIGAGEIDVSFDDNKVHQAIASLRLAGAVRFGSTDRRGLLSESLSRCRAEKRKVIIFLGGDTNADQTPTEDACSLLPQELEELGYGPDDYEVIWGDDTEAEKKIDAFGSSGKWILISINMVSEGTDIPQLSAAIFLTSITAKQTTVQRIGRALRAMGDNDPHKDALVFMFKDKNYVDLADEIDAEIRQEIDLRKKRREGEGGDRAEGQRRARAEAIGIGDGRMQMVKFHGSEWPAERFESVRKWLMGEGMPATMLHAALQLKMTEGTNGGRA